MCTSASLQWAMACLATGMAPECSKEQMQRIMLQASRTHRTCAMAVRQGILQTYEVLELFPLPPRYCMRELFGCVGYVPTTEAGESCVSIDDTRSVLESAKAVVFTCAGHSTCFVCCRHGCFHFDSAVAAVRRIDLQAHGVHEALRAVLARAHFGMRDGTDFTMTVICEAGAGSGAGSGAKSGAGSGAKSGAGMPLPRPEQ